MCGLQSAVTVLVGLTLFGGFSKLQALAEGLAKDGIKIDVGGDLRAVGAIVGLFAMAEWLVIALSRQHHDALSTSVAERFALPIEEEVRSPRVKLDVRWVLTRMKRKTQGAVVLLISALPGLFFLVLLDALSGLPDLFDAMAASGNIHLDDVLSSAWLLCVSAYWAAVFILGKTSLAWRVDVGDPFFVRFVDTHGPRHRFWMLPLRLWARVMTRLMSLIRRPATLLERASWEGFGLAVARLVMAPPVLYLWCRPFVPVAASAILVARAPDVVAGADAAPQEDTEPAPLQVSLASAPSLVSSTVSS